MGGPLPLAVQNLRRIWSERKQVLEVNQAQAAEMLGWSQGMFAHYLNAITELNDDAIAKFANFLEVDPYEIDPDYKPIEANLMRVPVRYVHDDIVRPSTNIMYRRRVPITVNESLCASTCAILLSKDLAPLGYEGQYILCCDMSINKKPNLSKGRKPKWLITKTKNQKSLKATPIDECPPNNQLDIKLLPLLAYLIN